MTQEDRILLKNLLTEQRVLSLSVLIEGKPYVSLLPFVFQVDLCAAFVQASDMAKHAAGLVNNSPFTLLIHLPDRPETNPMELPRVSLQGTVQRLIRDSDAFDNARNLYKSKFRGQGQYFDFADFNLYQLNVEKGRYVAGFGRVYNLKGEDIRSLGAL